MAIKTFKPTTPSQRVKVGIDYRKELTAGVKPEKTLLEPVKKRLGRSGGKIVVRHKGGRQKRFYRKIDFKRNKYNIPATVVSIEYDPNRTAFIALLHYIDGEKRYILSPQGVKTGDQVISGEKIDTKIGNAMPISKIPLGSEIHNIELQPGRGGQLARSAGSSAMLMSREGKYSHVKLPSGEIRLILNSCYATLGSLSNEDNKNVKLGKAGRSRHRGIRPTVRGVAMHPGAHPHGGGEGRTGTGMPPKTPWGKRAMGLKTRKKKKRKSRFIIKGRKK